MTLVRDACRHAEVEAQQRGLRFVLDLPETLMVSADGEALARVYANVIDNAVKFSLPDGEVRISLREAGGAVEMVCADDGVGISEEDQATVFDMFRRARDSQARDVPGSGVGLAISQRIVARLGGSIDLVSTAGRGLDLRRHGAVEGRRVGVLGVVPMGDRPTPRRRRRVARARPRPEHSPSTA